MGPNSGFKVKMSQKFNLKWEDFQTNVSKSFRSLKAESELYDVTLVSEDEQLIQAHKIEENEDLRTDEEGITVDSTLNEGIHSQPKRTNIETAIMEECENIAHDENSGDNIFETLDKIVTQNAGNEIDCHAPDIVTDESVEDIPVSTEKYRRRSSRRSQERILQLDMQNKTL